MLQDVMVPWRQEGQVKGEEAHNISYYCDSEILTLNYILFN